ncbi:MAG: hypothetical protein ACQESA_03235 [Patescibacteria group bacterium]
MKKVILMRWGDGDNTGKLSLHGNEQIRSAVSKIQQEYLNNGERIHLVSSPEGLAKQSIQIANDKLKLSSPLETWECLSDVNRFIMTMCKILDIWEKYDVLICATYLEYIEEFPSFFGSRTKQSPKYSLRKLFRSDASTGFFTVLEFT